MEQNHPDFPQLRCADHKSPIILVCPSFNPDSKSFFCAKCIALGQNKDNTNLITYEEFVQNIATSSGINVPASAEALQIAEAKKAKISQFESHIEQEKSHISALSTELQNQYQEKCNEMVTELKGVLESQKSIFRNFYNRFEQEIKIDNEQEANIPKFTEIRDKVSAEEDINQVESYLAQIVHQKEAWNSASVEIRTIGKRTEDYYREKIEKLSENQPTFNTKDQILDIWTNGLKELIEKVKSQSGCFTNLYEHTQGIVLNIQAAQEVSLITNQMIKEDTELVLNFSKKPLTQQEAKKIGSDLATLTNLRHLTIILENNHTQTESVHEITQALSVLTGLNHLHINLYGNKLGDEFSTQLGAQISHLTNLESLHFEIGMNDLSSASVQNLVAHFGVLTNLKKFTFDAKYNKITDVSSLSQSLSHFATSLTHLNVSFGGFSLSKNSLTLDSQKSLVRAIRQLTNLTHLVLDLGYTDLENSSAIELSQSLKDLTLLRQVNLQLYQNPLESRAASKIVKRLVKIQRLNDVVVNFNFNDKIKLEGATEIINSFRQMHQLQHLDLSLIKVGVEKDQQVSLRDDLTKNKLGSAFEKVVVLF
ncbi:hypothetical protein TTHERM_00516300 (macronuclear) [Tetrahymena thermophila SB210]|uniref:Kinase domain protein n=1 Tax=Tetrahymena thermophila (strain SB210) TaxID=312017 RepID=I7ME58_TETTS|nr:hypothetical protein TTHERM_00516300 [Tetrahymena thermophila SB210]EAR94996.1 hypothetical protein TTHERM_00516300 [Tetrahymena thermophila SB210]|eukprot:XP_001015241.1 hypothetical protein TTHERM_00516300 [Tetrahymena thermophila SB210]